MRFLALLLIPCFAFAHQYYDEATGYDMESLITDVCSQHTFEKCSDPLPPNSDNDTIPDATDNCPLTDNEDQADFDGDGAGDACDSDIDGDGVDNAYDQCPNTPPGATVDATGCEVVAPPSGGVYIVSNEDAGFSTSGPVTTVTGAGYKDSYVQVGAYANKRSVYWDMGNQAGDYGVCVRYIGQWNAPNIPYKIGLVATVNVDHTVNSDTWVDVGTYTLPENIQVSVSASSLTYTGGKFDSVAFVPAGTPCSEVESGGGTTPPVDPSLGYQGCLDWYGQGNAGFCQISNKTVNSELAAEIQALPYYNNIKGSGGTNRLLDDWCGSAYDPDAKIMYFNCGGHNDYYGNGWIAYHVTTGEWENLLLPIDLTYVYPDPTYGYCYHPGPGQMTSQHNYDGLDFLKDRGTILISNQNGTQKCSSTQPAGTTLMPYTGRNMLEFNPSPTEIRAGGIAPLSYRVVIDSTPSYGYPRTAVVSGGIKAGGRITMDSLSFNGDVLQNDGQFIGNAQSGQGSATEFKGGMVSYINGGYFYEWDAQGNIINSLTGIIPNGGGAGLACCADVCLMWNGNLGISEYVGGAWSEVIETEGPANGDSRVYSKFQCAVPEENIFVGVSDVDQPVHLYKWRGTPTASLPAPQPIASMELEGSGPFPQG